MELVEDYVELISDLLADGGEARQVDIATRLGVAQPTVAKMLRRLARDGWVVQRPYRGVFLTPEGEALAHASRQRHQTVERFAGAGGGRRYRAARCGGHRAPCQRTDTGSVRGIRAQGRGRLSHVSCRAEPCSAAVRAMTGSIYAWRGSTIQAGSALLRARASRPFLQHRLQAFIAPALPSVGQHLPIRIDQHQVRWCQSGQCLQCRHARGAARVQHRPRHVLRVHVRRSALALILADVHHFGIGAGLAQGITHAAQRGYEGMARCTPVGAEVQRHQFRRRRPLIGRSDRCSGRISEAETCAQVRSHRRCGQQHGTGQHQRSQSFRTHSAG